VAQALTEGITLLTLAQYPGPVRLV
jgi:hypothetical protein